MFGRGRNADTIEALFAAHFDPIYRFAAHRVGRDAALDIAAETFAQALRSANRLDPGRDARAWLFGIANNVIRHHRRAEERRLRAYATLARNSDASGGNGSEPEQENILRAALVEALLRLDSRDREVLLLLAWADLSYEEIATALEIRVGTVRSRIHRARRLLRESLVTSDDLSSGDLVVAAGEEA